MNAARLVFAFCVFFSCFSVHAGCPRGYYWTGQGNICAPDMEPESAVNRPRPPRVVFSPSYGAIAVADNLVWGAVDGVSKVRKARSGAVDSCKSKGGRNCELVEEFRNGCGAVMVSEQNVFWAVAADFSTSESSVKSLCAKAGDVTCELAWSVCTYDQRR